MTEYEFNELPDDIAEKWYHENKFISNLLDYAEVLHLHNIVKYLNRIQETKELYIDPYDDKKDILHINIGGLTVDDLLWGFTAFDVEGRQINVPMELQINEIPILDSSFFTQNNPVMRFMIPYAFLHLDIKLNDKTPIIKYIKINVASCKKLNIPQHIKDFKNIYMNTQYPPLYPQFNGYLLYGCLGIALDNSVKKPTIII